jgi:ABC-type transport system substrate-binding protein
VTVLPPLEAARALLAGTVDVLPTLTPDAFALLEQAPGVRVLEQPGEQLWVLGPNLSAPPWDALEARRALLGALDRQALVAALAPAPARVAWGWRADPPPKLPPASMPLAGLTLTLNVAPIRSADDTHAVLAKALVEQLTRAGLQVTVRERADLREGVQEGAFEGMALLVRDTTELTRFLNVTGPAGQISYTTSQGAHFDGEMVERLARIKNSLYAERRDALELEFQKAWFERLPMLPLVATSRLSAVRESLEGPEWGRADALWWNLAQWRFTQP